jgi:hypothetical protein
MTLEARESFNKLRKRFTKAPILTYFDFNKDVILKMDASD